ncbi:mitochondrial carrier [Sphaerulina musiva SO2202]|uniref:Mitochondrial thiamine pyrophosphate carrier 1 n=1 Tax=Sphaerulina musiva (strain SO2202) TaxID=692275 RepID=N1QE87_SPHMS|nr:mitochondrial carrier [Sphaerulina musiva SO2202]EMF09222.1 mitochondrial carrier [Sphaerulina musiva SO2202]
MDGESQAQRDARLRSLWERLDTKKKGTLDYEALKRGLGAVNHPLKDADGLIQDMLTACDIDRDGKISYDEFCRFCTATEKELWQLFQSIDQDRSGRLDKGELSSAFERAGVTVSKTRLDRFFSYIDKDRDGTIDFGEWRDFLLFIPTNEPGLSAVLSYYQNTTKLNSEGDVHLSDEAVQGLGYFLAGGLAGVTSRTATAPLDRLKVYLIAQTGSTKETVQAVKSAKPVSAAQHGVRTLWTACQDLWAAGGVRSLFAGNGLNVIKVMPESSVKFGAYEASKRAIAKLEGHDDPKRIKGSSSFVAGGIAGMIAQATVYPLDTLKFQMQCEIVKGGEHGTRLIWHTAKKMWARNGVVAFYKGLPMGLIGMFPYAAIDLGIFDTLKKRAIKRNRARNPSIKHDEDALPNNFSLALMGGFSGAFGASIVYPLNLLRTRLQSQGTFSHPRTYTGIVDVTRQTIQGEGVRGLFKGLTPNLLKVVPAVSITYVVYENSKKFLHLQ